MRQKWKRLSAAAAVLLFLAVMAVMAGCSAAGGSEGDSEKVRLMVWSPSEDQSRGSGEWLQKCCAAFAEQHPEWDITFVYGIADEATAANSIAQDPEAGADVFMYANDNITTLTDSQAIAKFGGKYEKQIRENASEALLNSVTLDGFLYGVPFTTNTWFMYYDKSVFSEEDIKSLETMLQKGVVSFPFTNGWYLPSFYFGNGCTMFGDGTREEEGVDFGGDNAVEVTNLQTVPEWPACGTDPSTLFFPVPGTTKVSSTFWVITWAQPLFPNIHWTAPPGRCTPIPVPKRSV